jgi:hypothetical protein
MPWAIFVVFRDSDSPWMMYFITFPVKKPEHQLSYHLRNLHLGLLLRGNATHHKVSSVNVLLACLSIRFKFIEVRFEMKIGFDVQINCLEIKYWLADAHFVLTWTRKQDTLGDIWGYWKCTVLPLKGATKYATYRDRAKRPIWGTFVCMSFYLPKNYDFHISRADAGTLLVLQKS